MLQRVADNSSVTCQIFCLPSAIVHHHHTTTTISVSTMISHAVLCWCGVQALTSCSSSPMGTSAAWCQRKGSLCPSRRVSSLLLWVELLRSGSSRYPLPLSPHKHLDSTCTRFTLWGVVVWFKSAPADSQVYGGQACWVMVVMLTNDCMLRDICKSCTGSAGMSSFTWSCPVISTLVWSLCQQSCM